VDIRHFSGHRRNPAQRGVKVRARRIHTQAQDLRCILIAFIVIIDAGRILWAFPNPAEFERGGADASEGIVGNNLDF